MAYIRFTIALTVFLLTLMALAMVCVIMAPDLIARRPSALPVWAVFTIAAIAGMQGALALEAALAMAKKALA